ncbi:MAG: YwbE family protein [Deltaproteobacteria bacterium]|nr:YwbE family protein [Deltaproteobacteria bacterium]
MNGNNRAGLKPGMQVLIVQKKDQSSGALTPGRVKDILTKSLTHHHGIKVRLETGEVGRVKQLLAEKT